MTWCIPLVKCDESNQEVLNRALTIIFGRQSAERDNTRPMVQFIPLDVVTGNDNNTVKFKNDKGKLEESFLIVNLRISTHNGHEYAHIIFTIFTDTTDNNTRSSQAT